MYDTTMLLYVFLAVITILLLWRMFRGDGIDLPGPRPWPLVGNIGQLTGKNLMLCTLQNWHKKYDGVYKMYRLGTPVIVVGTYEAIYEVMVTRGNDFAGRPGFFRWRLMSDSLPAVAGIVMSDPTPAWKLFRQTAHQSVKQFDRGMLRIQEMTNGICMALMDSFASENGRPFCAGEHIMRAVMSNLALVFIGKKLPLDHAFIEMFMESERSFLRVFAATGPHALLDLFPWLSYFSNETEKLCDQLRRKHTDMLRVLTELTSTDADDEDEFKPMVSSFADLAPKIDNADTNIRMACMEMLLGGSSTSTVAFTTFLNVITHYGGVYSKLQAEVDSKLGDRNASLEDRNKMPYMSATLFELVRFASIVPLGVPHKSLVDSKIGDVFVPQGTEVLTNLFALLHDEKYWPEPFEFKPERFLDASGNLVAADHVNRKRLLAFGAGPRVCVGEVFAQSRLFLMMCFVIQSFEVEQPEPKVSCDPRNYELAIVLLGPDCKLRMTRRHNDHRI